MDREGERECDENVCVYVLEGARTDISTYWY